LLLEASLPLEYGDGGKDIFKLLETRHQSERQVWKDFLLLNCLGIWRVIGVVGHICDLGCGLENGVLGYVYTDVVIWIDGYLGVCGCRDMIWD
jgi:hypothetical protein